MLRTWAYINDNETNNLMLAI